MPPHHLRWVPEQRLVVVEYPEGTVLDGPLASEQVAALRGFLAEAGVLGCLARVDGVTDATFQYRRELAGFFRENRARTAMALLGGSAFVRVLATLFAKATAVRLAFFDDEAAAMAWLRDVGVVK